jgi:excisionase family DNA binding protein
MTIGSNAENKIRAFFTPDELAEFLAISKTTVYRLVNKRQLPFNKVGGVLRFRRDAIDRNYASTSVPSVPTAFSGRVFARKNLTCAPETGKSIQSAVRICKLYLEGTGSCVFRMHLYPRSFV